jgi:hypothetical protein
MIAGYNQAWFLPLSSNAHYGSDLSAHFDLRNVEAAFDLLRQAGSSHIRLWLFEANNQPIEGLRFKGDAAQGMTPEFRQNLIALMELAQSRQISIYWTLLAPNTGYNPQAARPADRAPQPPYLQLYGRLFDVQKHPYEAFSFIERVVLPVAELLEPYCDHIYALDLVNEIDFVAATYLPQAQERFPIMANWLDAVVRSLQTAIPHPPRLGVSFGYEQAGYPLLSHIAATGLQLGFYDLHTYNNEGAIHLPPDLPSATPWILGEFGRRSPANAQPEDPQLQARTTAAFLASAAALGAEAAFAWRLLEDYRLHWSFFENTRHGARIQVGAPRPAADVVRQWNISLNSKNTTI